MASTTVSPKDVSELRTRTGAGMMDCKRALEESGGNLDKASEILRKKGIAKAEKRTGKTAFVARTDEFGQLAREIALHIASADPIGVNPEDVPADLLDRERRIAEEQVAKDGKPENIRGKIVDGKLKKFVAERTLTEQPYVKDDSKTVGQLLKEASGKLGEAISVRRFARFKIGEA